MIRELRKADINKVANIWLDTNITAHYFIPAQYWQSNFELVKELLLQATDNVNINLTNLDRLIFTNLDQLSKSSKTSLTL